MSTLTYRKLVGPVYEQNCKSLTVTCLAIHARELLQVQPACPVAMIVRKVLRVATLEMPHRPQIEFVTCM
eukprot:3625665-Amphidinium_carterae.2